MSRDRAGGGAPRARGRLATFLIEAEQGGATIWNLFWLVGIAALLGLGVDTTAAMNSKARLQSIADAASHAAAMDLFPVSGGAVDTALDYALKNTPDARAVIPDDITLGHWDRETQTFTTDNPPFLNAVRVVAGRESGRGNPLTTSFLRLIGFDNWEINAVSISSYFGDISLIDRCRKNGLFAGGKIDLTANNLITREYCVHGERGFKITQNNIVTCDVELSIPDPSLWRSGSVSVPSGLPGACSTGYGGLSNSQMIEQVFQYRTIPSRARAEYEKVREMLDSFVAGDLDNDPFNAIPPYIQTVQAISRAGFNGLAASGALVPGTLYVVSCAVGGNKLEPTGLIRNVGIYTDCVINIRSAGGGGGNGSGGSIVGETIDALLDGVPPPEPLTCAEAIARGYRAYDTYLDTAPGRAYRDGVTTDTEAERCGMEPGASGVWDNVFVFSTAFDHTNGSPTAISFPSNMQLGRVDGCHEGGGVRIYSAASVKAPSGLTVHGSHLILLGNATMAAGVGGTFGMTMEAEGDISFSAQGAMGGCSPDERDLANDVVFTIRPIAIVN